MTRAISVLLGLGLLAATGVAADFPRTFQEHATVQESLSRVHPRMRASWLRQRGLDDSYYTTFHRPESSGLACIGRWPWGPSWELAGRDTVLYLGSGSGVRILSIADSVQPRMLGQINARGLVSQVVVQDSLLFVACGSWGAQIYSVSDPANPRELGSMNAVIGDLCVQDTFCYTAGGDNFRIYNFAYPAQPAQVGVVSDGGDVIAGANGYVYVGHGSSGSGLNVYDVHDPANPVLVNTLGGVQLAMLTRGHWLLRVSEQPAYFSILDVSDPHSIYEIGRINGYGGLALFADDKYAYLSCSYEHAGLFVVDVSDSSQPMLRDSLNPEGVTEWDPYVPHVQCYGYLADDYGGLVTVDMHDVSSLNEAWSGYKSGMSLDIEVGNGRAYVASRQSGMQIIDVADPAAPFTLGLYDTVGARATYTATAHDSFAYVGMLGVPGYRNFRVILVSDPSSPQLVAQETVPSAPLDGDMVLQDSLCYVAAPSRFYTINVARPREPVLVGSCGLSGDVWDLDVEDSMAYVTSNVLTMVSIARPDSPRVVATWNAMVAVDVEDTIAYTIGSGAVWSVSIARPAQPYVLDTVGIPDWKSDVVVGESLLFAGGQTLYVIDKRDPRNLRLAGRWTPPEEFRRLLWSPPYIYAACYEAGVCILETLPTGIAERRSSDLGPRGVFAHPSVTRGALAVDLSRPTDVIYVRDAAGRRIAGPFTKGGDANVCRLEIDLSGHPDGVYFIESATTSTTRTAKVIKTGRR